VSALDDWLARLIALPAPDDAEQLYAGPAGALRLENLRRYLRRHADADTVLVGEAPGWRGMTVTGIPFTSMRELDDRYLTPTDAAAPWEASSRVVHAALSDWSGPRPLCWAIYPHHPFVAPDRHTNRTPRPAEIAAGAPLATALLELVGARRVVAVGRKAEAALGAAGVPAIAVRHPAQGGAALFTTQLRALNA
jgi:uracil-DNA glycosylase